MSDASRAAVIVSPRSLGSDRVRLAREALAAALSLPDVFAGDAGLPPIRVTADTDGALLRGVSVTAQADGRYSVDLRLVCAIVPLGALSEQVRRRVHAGARRADLGHRLGAVNIEIAHVRTPAEMEPGGDATVAHSTPPAGPAPEPAPPRARSAALPTSGEPLQAPRPPSPSSRGVSS